ncbi:unnamed protein product [Phaedon cochleariae]|uniref:Gustatory receptor n=1 Tax=Phaedon cochleariae TaxID=80249 RepID=A0A9N9X691_PHACE|nr:unnamed protein product [Phaedon cochleariae]
MNRPKASDFVQYKNAFLFAPRQIDYRVLKGLFKSGTYYAASPIGLNKNGLVFSMRKILAVCVLSAYVMGSLLTMDFVPHPVNMTSDLYKTCALSFVISCIWTSNFVYTKNWEMFYRYLDKMEQVMDALKFEAEVTYTKQLLGVFLSWLSYAALHSYRIWNWIELNLMNNFSYSCGHLVTVFFITTIFTYIFFTVKYLHRRYSFINKKIENLADNHENFDMIVKFLKTGDRISEQMNIIFGWQFFLFVSFNVAYIFCVVTYSLFSHVRPDRWMSSGVLAVFSTIITIIIVMSCNKVERCGLQIVQTCYTAVNSTKDARTKEKLVLLAQYAEEWRPIFSAAGFYDINQLCLNALFACSIDYLVIVVQFNMMLSSSLPQYKRF